MKANYRNNLSCRKIREVDNYVRKTERKKNLNERTIVENKIKTLQTVSQQEGWISFHIPSSNKLLQKTYKKKLTKRVKQ